MKAPRLASLASAGAPLILAAPVSAGFIGLKAVHKPNPYALTWNIYAQFDERPGDLVFAVAGTPLSPLNVNVRGGTFYQNVFGDDGAPSPDLIAIYPSLAYDTFVTIGKKTSIGDEMIFAPGWPGFGPDRLAGSSIGWFIHHKGDPQGIPNANNQVLLMQLSTQNGTGFFGTILVVGFSNGLDLGSPANADVDGYVSFDTQQAPAPGALALLGAAGLIGARRRRP